MDRQIANKLAGILIPVIVGTGINLAILAVAEARNINNTTRTSVNRNVNHNRNVNVNRHVDVDVDVDRRHYHPVARAAATTAAVVTTAAVTSAVVGSMVRTLPAGMLGGSRQWPDVPELRRRLVSAAIRGNVGDLRCGKSAELRRFDVGYAV